jgi:hypothetical protein
MEISDFYMNIWRRREPAGETEKELKIFFNIFVFHFRPLFSQSEQYQKHKQHFLIFSAVHIEILIFI